MRAEDIYRILDEGLDAHGGDDSIGCVSELDGYFNAIGCARELIPPSRWMPAIWGDAGQTRRWANVEAAQEFAAAAMALYNAAIDQLNNGVCEPLFIEREVQGRKCLVVDEWCEGFRRGLELWGPLSAGEKKILFRLTEPMRLFASDEGWRRLERMTDAEVARRQQRIEPAVLSILGRFRFGRAAPLAPRTAPKVGRNDPCFCGSGRKYKHCCLH